MSLYQCLHSPSLLCDPPTQRRILNCHRVLRAERYLKPSPFQMQVLPSMDSLGRGEPPS